MIWTPAEPGPSIVTERLVLTRIARGDVDELVAMLRDPALYDFIGDAPASAAEASEQVERWLRGSGDPDLIWINYVARHRDSGRLVGLAQATVPRGTGSRPDTCEIAYLVAPSEQGRGLGTEMMTEFCAELRATLDPAELTAHIHPEHAASEAVARAVGLAPTADHADGERVWRAYSGDRR